MNNIHKMIKEAKDFSAFAASYVRYVSALLKSLDVKALESLCQEFEGARREAAVLFIAGNGGSAATSSHMAKDLGFGLRRHADPVLRAMSLTDNVAVLTALANDEGYEQIFVRQLQLYFRPGDRLLVISASGNSPNLVAAAQWVKEKKGRVLGLLGFDGGQLKNLCDAAVVVSTPPGEYGPVEDVHMILDHLLHAWLWTKNTTAA